MSIKCIVKFLSFEVEARIMMCVSQFFSLPLYFAHPDLIKYKLKLYSSLFTLENVHISIQTCSLFSSNISTSLTLCVFSIRQEFKYVV